MNRILTGVAVAALFAGPGTAQDAFVLDDIVFSAGLTAQEAARIGVSIDVVEEEELRAAGEVPLADYLATLPGVSITRNGPPGTSTTLRIRGAGQGLVAVFVDGIPVNDPTTTSGQYDGFGSLTTGALRRVEVLKGSQSAIYGTNAVAGVISITTIASGDEPEGLSQTASVEGGSYNTLSAEYGFTNRTGPLTLSFGASHTRSGGFSAAEENVGSTEADPSQSSRISIGARYEVTPELTIGANAFFQSSEAEFDEFVGANPADGTPRDEISDATATGVRLFAEYEGLSWSHALEASYLDTSRNLQSLSVASPFATPFSSSFDGERTTFQYLATTNAIANTDLTLGVDWQEDTGTFTGLIGNSRSISTAGVLAEAVWAATPDIDVVLSGRYEDNSAFGDVTTGRLALSYRLNDATTLRASVGTGFRAPVLSELYGTFPIGGGQFFSGNPDLEPEDSVSYEVGVDHAFAGGASVSATLFVLEVDNFITYDDCTRDPVTFVCTSSATYINVAGASTFQGVELSGSLPLGERVTLTGAYTYTDARRANDTRVVRVPRHDLALGADVDFEGGWSNSTILQGVSDVMNSASVPGDDYTVVDTTFTYAFDDRLEAYLRVENLFDEQYQTVRGYGTSDRAFYIGLRTRF